MHRSCDFRFFDGEDGSFFLYLERDGEFGYMWLFFLGGVFFLGSL